MKASLLSFFLLTSLPLLSLGQVYFPKVIGNELIYKIDTLNEDIHSTPLYDTYNLELKKWSNNYWEASVTLMPGYRDTKVFIEDKHFTKDYSYRIELEKYSAIAKKENQTYLGLLQKKYGKKFGEAIYYETPVIGMSSDMVLKSLGSPKDVNRTETSRNISEQWIYYEIFGKERTDSRYYYFDNGKLTTIQD